MLLSWKENRSGYQLIFARLISFVGSGIYSICFPLYILHETNSLATTGLFFSITFFPSVLLIPLLGVLIERWNLKRFLIYSDGISAIIFLSMLLSISLFGFSLLWISLLTILFNINDMMFQVASNSIFIHVVKQDSLEQLNGMKSTFDNLVALIAPLIGTALYAVFGIQTILLLNAVSFLLAALIVSLLHFQRKTRHNLQKEPYRQMLTQGIRYIFSNQLVLSLFLLVMMLNFLVAPTEEIFAPGMLQVKYQLDAVAYGWTSTSISLGVVSASVYLSLKKKAASTAHLKVFFLAQGIIMVTTGITSQLFYHQSTLWFYMIYLLLSFLTGVFSTMVNVPLMSSFQFMVERDFQARFFSMLSFFSRLMIPFGTIVAGYSSDLLGADIAYLMNGALLILLILFIYHRLNTLAFLSNTDHTQISQT